MSVRTELAPALVISPHLDDAVLACGEWIAAHPGTRVLTIFAGAPSEPRALTEWDAVCGFSSAAHAVAARRLEDSAALALLRASPEWLDFCDDQYGVRASARRIVEALRRALRELRPAAVLLPLGLFHRDHERAHDAALRVFGDDGERDWYAYEDVPYRGIPGLVRQRLLRLSGLGIAATPMRPCSAYRDLKRRAVQCYASQLRGLSSPGRPGDAEARLPECLWRLQRARVSSEAVP